MEKTPCQVKVCKTLFRWPAEGSKKKHRSQRVNNMLSFCLSLNWLMLLQIIVSCLFRKSLSSEDIPDDWKLANVTAIFKKGSKYSLGNYRSVSLTIQLCKVMESLIRNKMVEHLEKQNLISNSQHGFLKNKSCLTNLLAFLEEATNYVDSGYPGDVLYLDFQKASIVIEHFSDHVCITNTVCIISFQINMITCMQ